MCIRQWRGGVAACLVLQFRAETRSGVATCVEAISMGGVIQESYSSGACDGTWANAKDIARLAKHARRWNDSAVPCATANLTMTCWFSPQATSAMVRVEVTGMRRAMRMGMYPFCMVD